MRDAAAEARSTRLGPITSIMEYLERFQQCVTLANLQAGRYERSALTMSYGPTARVNLLATSAAGING